jgi:multiple sugar transport system substrate-binding protein
MKHISFGRTIAGFLRAWAMVLAAALVVGCGAAPASSPTTSAPAASPPTAAPPTSAALPGAALSFAFPDDAANARSAAELIAAYTTARPDVAIEPQPLPAQDYAQQLLAKLESDAPDLFVGADSQAAALINRKAVLDLQPLLVSEPALKLDDFHPAALAAWRRGDNLYGLPADVTPQVLFYNKNLFDAAGVSYPTAGWTWDDWLASAQKLTVRSGDQVSRYGTALSQWSAMVWGNGGELVDSAGSRLLLDSPEAAQGVQFAADMVNVHKVAPPPKDAGGPDPVQLFQEQKVAMLPGASGMASALAAANLPFEWAIAPLPAGRVPASPLSVAGLAISSRSQNQQAALGFAAWAVGPAGQAIKANLLPFAAPALRSAGARPVDIAGADAILQSLDHGRTLPQLEVWPEIKALVDQALVPVWQGGATAEAAYRRVAPEANAMLKAG